MIYINDFNEIVNIYEDFYQDHALKKIVEVEKNAEKQQMAKERATTILNSTYRELLKNRQEMVRKLVRYILVHDLEWEDFLFLFTKKWEKHQGSIMVSNILATIVDYVRVIKNLLKGESNASLMKYVSNTFVSVILSEAYFLKLLISINKKNKLKLDLPDDKYINSLVPFTYHESKIKRLDPNKVCKYLEVNS